MSKFDIPISGLGNACVEKPALTIFFHSFQDLLSEKSLKMNVKVFLGKKSVEMVTRDKAYRLKLGLF